MIQKGHVDAQVDIANLPILRFRSFQDATIVHGITTRTPMLPLNGNMSYMVGRDPDLVRTNRQAWAEAIGYNADRLVLGRQVHETSVLPVDESHAGNGSESVETSIRRVDGLMTDTPGLPIGVMAADCVPILLYDPVNVAVAAVHAGWRGTVDGIISEAINAMEREYGTRPSNLRAGLGPSICASCYQVGEEVISRWASNPASRNANAVSATKHGLYFDLAEANRTLLREAGVTEDSIESSDVCTKCANGTMFSRRGLGPKTGLFTTIIMLSSARSNLRGAYQ